MLDNAKNCKEFNSNKSKLMDEKFALQIRRVQNYAKIFNSMCITFLREKCFFFFLTFMQMSLFIFPCLNMPTVKKHLKRKIYNVLAESNPEKKCQEVNWESNSKSNEISERMQNLLAES